MKKYANIENVFHVIGHNGSVFVLLTLRTLLFLLVLYVIFVVLDAYIAWSYLPWIFGILGIGFFIKYIIDFLNLYLDGLILSEKGITLFMWEGLFDYKTDFFEWDKIEAISHHQNSFWDRLFAKGDLLVKLEHGIEYPFENVNFPQKQAEKIMKYKQQFTPSSEEGSSPFESDKFSIIAEALSEVVKEYMEKKSSYDDEEKEIY